MVLVSTETVPWHPSRKWCAVRRTCEKSPAKLGFSLVDQTKTGDRGQRTGAEHHDLWWRRLHADGNIEWAAESDCD